MVTLRHATLEERKLSYEWYFNIGEQDKEGVFINGKIYSWEEYKQDFEDFYFEKSGQNKGSVMIVEADGEDIGCVCYTSFHLKPQTSELDIWLKDESVTGKGYGTQALKALVDYLYMEKQMVRFLIRPNKKNVRAIKAYKKTGFREVSDERSVIQAYIKPHYAEAFGDGSTVLLVKEMEHDGK